MPLMDEQGGIVLGPGNEISNVPQNERLLALIQNTPVWGPEKVLKLSQFLQQYPGNVPMGKHVALVTLAMRMGQQVAQEALPDYWDWEENVIDPLDGGSNDDESKETNQLFYRRVPMNGIGLLVETFVSTDEKQVQTAKHFIIGVAPAL